MFFSGHRLATQVAKLIQDKLTAGAVVGDPACGAGDLLLACMYYAPLHGDIRATLASWGEKIIGLDIHQEMAESTQARLALLAAMRTCEKEESLTKNLPRIPKIFTQIRAGNYFTYPELFANADCVVMNPPFTEIDAPKGCDWSSGKVQQAAVFTKSIIDFAKPGQEIVAVLPDVLRSGTRYNRWRQIISNSCEIKHLDVFGRFDAKTDVDVFILHLQKRKSAVVGIAPQWKAQPNIAAINPINKFVVSDLFNVSVGAFVPHRHKNKGPWVPYADVNSVPAHTEVKELKSRRFNGTLHKGPFVVIRRTSSPSDTFRATASLVNTTKAVAVENHLIVLSPRDGTLKSCRQLMSILCRSYINDWLNSTIRCRHLTVKAVKELPIINWS